MTKQNTKEYDAVKEMVYGIRSDLFDRLVELSKVCQSDYRFDTKDEVADEIDDLIEHSQILGKREERRRIIELINTLQNQTKMPYQIVILEELKKRIGEKK